MGSSAKDARIHASPVEILAHAKNAIHAWQLRKTAELKKTQHQLAIVVEKYKTLNAKL